MRLFKKKKSEEAHSKMPRPANKDRAIHHHQSRIDNLNDEIESLIYKVKKLEANDDMPKSHRDKEIDMKFLTMAFRRYEIEGREELIKWLSS